MQELLSNNEISFQGYADAIKQDGLGKVKDFMGKCIRDEVCPSLNTRAMV